MRTAFAKLHAAVEERAYQDKGYTSAVCAALPPSVALVLSIAAGTLALKPI